MTLEFRPTIKSINIANEDLTKITLEVKNGSLDGKYDDLRRFSGKTVNITIIPEYYSYSVPFDKSTNAPTQRYLVNADGTIDFVKEEQTQLEIDEKGNIDLENRDFMVTKEIVDDFILAARSLEFPGSINPRDVLIRMNDNEPVEEIAEDYEMSELNLVNELEKARSYYAPYADAWSKKQDEVIFQDKTAETVEDEDDSVKSEDELTENNTEAANLSDEPDLDSDVENEKEVTPDSLEDKESEVDPY